jgi:hypothetical protein
MNDNLISRNYIKLFVCDYEKYIENSIKVVKAVPIEAIDNAPTVEPFEPDYVGAERLKARQRGYEEGYRMGMEIGKTLNPKIKQGEWIKTPELFRDRICSHCRKQIPYEQIGKFCIECGADMRKETENEI